MAAALPRYGADRRRAPAASRRGPGGGHFSPRPPAAAKGLAGRYFALSRDRLRWAEFRLRPLRAKEHPRGARAPRSAVLGDSLLRGRAYPARDARPVRRRLRAERLPSGRVLSLLWSGRGHV